MTVLDDRETAQYTHTLKVTGKLHVGGLYQCTVSNAKPSEAMAKLTVQGNAKGTEYRKVYNYVYMYVYSTCVILVIDALAFRGIGLRK